jgi:hypothetical protein
VIFLGFFEIELSVLLLFSSIFSGTSPKWGTFLDSTVFHVKTGGLDIFRPNREFIFLLGPVDFPKQISGFFRIRVFEFIFSGSFGWFLQKSCVVIGIFGG